MRLAHNPSCPQSGHNQRDTAERCHEVEDERRRVVEDERCHEVEDERCRVVEDERCRVVEDEWGHEVEVAPGVQERIALVAPLCGATPHQALCAICVQLLLSVFSSQ